MHDQDRGPWSIARSAGICAWLTAMLIATAFPAAAQGKYALIIANQDYQHGGSLENPIKDAEKLSQTLSDAGFSVRVEKNLNLSQMRRTISEFGLARSESDDVAMVYYSGHGAEFDGVNYLIPVDARLEDIRTARHEAVTLDDVQAFLERDVSDEMRAGGRYSRGLNIIVLDACRNNPYPARTRSIPAGLAQTDGAAGTLIWYATQPGEKADDGAGKTMSPFASSFVTAVGQSGGEPVEETFKRISLATLDETEGRQRPWQAGFVTGTFSFKPRAPNAGGAMLAEFDPARLDAGIVPFKPDDVYKWTAATFGDWKVGTYRRFVKSDESVPDALSTLEGKAGVVSIGSNSAFQEVTPDIVATITVPGPFAFGNPGGYSLGLHVARMGALQAGDAARVDFDVELVMASGSVVSGGEAGLQKPNSGSWRPTIEAWSDTVAESRGGGLLLADFSREGRSLLPSASRLRLILDGGRMIELKLEGLDAALKLIEQQDKLRVRLVQAFESSGLGNAIAAYRQGSGLAPVRSDLIAFADRVDLQAVRSYFDLVSQIDVSSYPMACGYHAGDHIRDSLGFGSAVLWSRHKFESGVRRRIEPYLQKTLAALAEAYAAGDIGCLEVMLGESNPRYWKGQSRAIAEAFLKRIRYPLSATQAGADISNLRNILTNYFPDGDSPIDYRTLRSVFEARSQSCRDRFSDQCSALWLAYLAKVRSHEVRKLEEGAWAACRETEAAPARGAACYREFAVLFPDSARKSRSMEKATELAQQEACGPAATAWRFISASSDVASLEAFATEFAACAEATLARERISALQ